jgi:hypothetical protein
MPALRRSLAIAAAVAAVAVIEGIACAPATLLDARLARLTGGVARLADADGTAWRGHGVLAAGSATMPVAWRVAAWPLVRGELHARLAPDAATGIRSPRADVVISGERVSLRDVELTLPAALPAALGGRMAGWVVAGDLAASAAALDWAPPASRGTAQLVWRSARLVAPGAAAPLDLGDVRVELTADGDRLSGPVANSGGDLDLRGELSLRAADGLRLSLAITPRRPDAQLVQALAAIGTAEGGAWRVEWRAPLR